jgi:hypothetical protein
MKLQQQLYNCQFRKNTQAPVAVVLAAAVAAAAAAAAAATWPLRIPLDE